MLCRCTILPEIYKWLYLLIIQGTDNNRNQIEGPISFQDETTAVISSHVLDEGLDLDLELQDAVLFSRTSIPVTESVTKAYGQESERAPGRIVPSK